MCVYYFPIFCITKKTDPTKNDAIKKCPTTPRRIASEDDDDNEAFLEETVMGEDDDFEDEMFLPNSSITTTSKDGLTTTTTTSKDGLTTITTSKDGVTNSSINVVTIPTIVVDDSQWETLETIVTNGQVSFILSLFLFENGSKPDFYKLGTVEAA